MKTLNRDIHRLLIGLQRLVDSGNTVLVIEHNLDVRILRVRHAALVAAVSCGWLLNPTAYEWHNPAFKLKRK